MRQIKSFFICITALILLISCGGEKVPEQQPSISANPSELNFDLSGGTQSVSVSATGSWSINTAGTWFTVEPSSGSGNASVSVTAGDNSRGNDREGSITFTLEGLRASVSVKQKGSAEDFSLPDTILEQEFKKDQGQFTIKNVNLPSDLNYIWQQTSQYGMKASAYFNNTNYEAESWLISPEIDLSKRLTAYLSFKHTGKFFGDKKKQAVLKVSADNGTSWEDIEIPNYFSGNDWTFVGSGDVDLGKKFTGKKIKIAFVYKSDSQNAPTWEIENVLISRNPGQGVNPETGELTIEDFGNSFKGVPTWLELPKVEDEKSFVIHAVKENGKILRNYSMNYSTKHHIATWVAYPLTDWYTKKNVSRTDAWSKDPYVSEQPNLPKSGDWYKNGYDRGHQIGSAERLQNYTLNAQTFYYTNMAPMLSNFNQNGPWPQLENKIRDWASSSSKTDTLYVVTGSLVKDGDKTVKDNDNKVATTVPYAFFKAILRYSASSDSKYIAAAYYFDHKNYTGVDFKDFALSVDELEKKTGIDFFANLDDSIEEKVEAVKPADNAFWK